MTMSIKTCGVCEGPIELPDGHGSCVFCLGCAHAEAAIIESNCPHCGEMSVKALRTRIAILLNEQPSLSSQQSPSASYAESWKTKSRRPEVDASRPAGEHMSAHPPLASRSPGPSPTPVEYVDGGFHPPFGRRGPGFIWSTRWRQWGSHVNRCIWLVWLGLQSGGGFSRVTSQWGRPCGREIHPPHVQGSGGTRAGVGSSRRARTRQAGRVVPPAWPPSYCELSKTSPLFSRSTCGGIEDVARPVFGSCSHLWTSTPQHDRGRRCTGICKSSPCGGSGGHPPLPGIAQG